VVVVVVALVVVVVVVGVGSMGRGFEGRMGHERDRRQERSTLVVSASRITFSLSSASAASAFSRRPFSFFTDAIA
jgi:hypothetical protein